MTSEWMLFRHKQWYIDGVARLNNMVSKMCASSGPVDSMVALFVAIIVGLICWPIGVCNDAMKVIEGVE